jgi:hypothetical protein
MSPFTTGQVTERAKRLGRSLGSQLRAAAARLRAEPADSPCNDGCACSSDAGGQTAPASDAAVACTLAPEAMPERLAGWEELLGAVSARSQTVDGRLRLEFRADVDVGKLARLCAAEQRCCNFFSFALTVDARGIALEVDAPEDAAGIVDALFGTS